LEKLVQQKYVRKLYRAQQRDKARYENILSLARPLDEAVLSRYRRRRAQKRLLELLAAEGEKTDAALREAVNAGDLASAKAQLDAIAQIPAIADCLQ